MNNEPNTLGDAVASIGSSITSPAKLGFAGYVLLVYAGRFETSKCEFLVVAIVFFCLQVAHDDWLRIVLNKYAERKGQK